MLPYTQQLTTSGTVIPVSIPYVSGEGPGVTVTVVTAGLSLACVLLLLAILVVFIIRRRKSKARHFFAKTHAAVYFTCLLVANLIQAIGTVMSSRWVQEGGVTAGGFCSTQGAIKNAGNLAVSFWALTLAIHTFMVLFLRWKIRDYALYLTVCGIWLLVGFLVLLGPAAIQKADKGPYFSISGFWCWIADPYPDERIALEYFWMLGSAGLSFVFYMLIFLRLRGNIVIEKGKVKFCRIESESSWKYLIGRDATDIQMTQVAKGMLGFPILFTVTVLPIAVCRFIAWGGSPVPFEATIFSDAVFSLSGVFNFVLFLTTKSLLPADGITWWISPRPHVSADVMEHGVQPYNVEGFAETYQAEAERNMVTLPPRTNASLGRLGNSSASLAPPPPAPSRPNRPASLNLELSSPTEINVDVQQPEQALSLPYNEKSSDHADFPQPRLSPSSPATWDDIDLGRRVSPARNEFTDPAPLAREAKRDTQYTTFSLSAYEYDEKNDEVPPPLPLPIAASRGAQNQGTGR